MFFSKGVISIFKEYGISILVKITIISLSSNAKSVRTRKTK